MKNSIGLLFLMMISVLLFAQDRRTDKSVLTIATFNGEFLWDGVEPEEGSVDFPHKNSPSEAEEHMEEIAEVIRVQSPDIINLVEVENIESLTTLNDKFLQGMGYVPKLVKGKDSQTGQDVCMLTRVDPEHFARTDNRAPYDGNTSGVSKNYFATFTINNQKFAFIGLHFVAFPNSAERGRQREAQASVITALADSLRNAGYSLVILGDFNDYDGGSDYIDHQNNQPITVVLEKIRKMNPTDASDDLINLSKFVSQNLRYTAFWDKNQNDIIDYPGEFSSIDHILISNQLASKVENVIIPHNHNSIEVSDHFMVFAKLRLDNQTPTTSTIKMIRAMPNPVGNENEGEYIVIKNFDAAPINVKDWYFVDLSDKKWTIGNITVNPNQEKQIKREGKPMSLNNTGDAIQLKSKDNQQIHSFSYSSTSEGEEIIID